MSVEFREVLKFWFEDINPEDWWKKSDELDAAIRDRFSAVHQMATACELEDWRSSPRGRLAEIIVLDQFSRNIYRNDPRSFAWDSMALSLSQEAINQKVHEDLSAPKRSFLYMPFMHSESQKIHREAFGLFSEPGLEYGLSFEKEHKLIIDQFGRYPHRNAILGRDSTPQEEAYLKSNPEGF